MGTFRRGRTIASRARARSMLEHSFGIDLVQDTPAGRLCTKNGWWGWNGHVERAVLYFLPEDMELVVFTNSRSARTPRLRRFATW